MVNEDLKFAQLVKTIIDALEKGGNLAVDDHLSMHNENLRNRLNVGVFLFRKEDKENQALLRKHDSTHQDHDNAWVAGT